LAGATPLGNMVIKLGLDDADFGKGVANSKKQITYLAKEMQANMKIADMAGNKLGKLGTKYESLSKIIKAQENQVAALKKAYDESFVDGKATDSTKRLAAQLQDANGKLANYKTQLQNTAGQLARMQVETQGVTGWLNKQGDALIKQGEKIQKFGSGVSKVGTALTVGVTAPLVAGATAVTKAAIEWESAFAGVKKTSDEVVDSNGNVVYSYDDLEASLRGLAKELPSTHTEIAAVAEAAGQLGIQTQDITAFTKTMIDMGESTNLSAEDAATAIAKIANITGMTSSEYQRFGSSVVALGNNFATTEADIVQMSNRLASAGTLAGLSNQEILGLATAMSSVGIEAEAGGTAMTQTLTAIEKAAVEGGDSLDQFAKVAGMSSSEFAKQWNEKPIEAIQSFIKGLGELDGKGESATLMLDEMGLSGVRQSNILKSLALASDTLSGAVDMSTQAWEENTALTNEAGTRYETTESKLKMLRNEVVDAAIEFGGPLVDALRDGLEASKPLIKSFGDMAKAFSSLDKEQQQNIIKWGLMAAAAGPALKLLGGGISTIGSVTKGVGKLSTGIVKLLASAAEKKALATLATSVTGVGTAASGAAGSAGVGAMTTALGASGLAGALPLIVGAGGLLAVGYGAWKLFGEEAWNSSRRVQRWGTDVGEATDTALGKVQTNTQTAIGEFNLLEQGISTNTEAVVGDFVTMGNSIETNLVNKISALKEMLNTLPEDVKNAGEKLTQEEIDNQQEYLNIVQENNEKIKTIRKEASDNNRELSYNDTVRIKALAEESATAYVKSLGKSQKETQQILSAMTGDVSKASKEQATEWLQNLGQQRQQSKIEYSQMQEDLKSQLVDAGYDLNSDYAKEMLGLLETSSNSATQITEDQMATILAKYPELAEEVFLANGQLISSMGDASQSAVEQNKKMMETMGDFSKAAAKNAEENKEKIKLTLDEANQFGEYWNGLVLDPKTGEVSTNAQDEVNKAAKSEAGWNKLMWISKDANVSSNVKMMIAEAAIANGKWDGMTYTEQQALLDSNVTKVMTQALQVNEDWDKLDFEQQKAILYSNTPEIMAETMLKLGLWDEYQPEIKDLNAENYNFLNTIKDSEEKIKNWDEIPDTTKELYADNYDLLTKIYASDEMYGRFKELPDSEKKFFGENDDLLLKILNSETSWKSWQELPDSQKNILLNNEDLMTKVFASGESLSAWQALPDPVKHMLGNNDDILAKVQDGTISVEDYNTNVLPALKKLFGDNSDIIQKLTQGESGLNTYNGNNPAKKILDGDSSSTQQASKNANIALDGFARNNPKDKLLKAQDNASTNAYNATQEVRNFMNLPRSITTTLTVKRAGGSIGGAAATFAATGTNYHPGGDMIVNDQSGPLYKEIVQFPGQAPFIPHGRNVYIPNAPVGAKVYKASRTKSIMKRLGVPKYADGVGIPEDSSLVSNLRSLSPNSESSSINFRTQDYSSHFETLIEIMSNFGEDLKNMKIILNNRNVVKSIETTQNNQQKLNDIKAGRRTV